MPPTLDQTIAAKRRRNWIATATTLAVLAGIGFFAWRITHFVTLIQSGELRAEDLRFGRDRTVSTVLAAAPVPEGEFSVTSADDPSLGTPEAEITIVEFADFGCPFSRKSSHAMRALAAKYGDRIHYVYRDFPIVELHPDAGLAAEAGECARLQGKFWEYHDKLYANQTNLRKERLLQFARELNMHERNFETCLDKGLFQAEVLEDYAAGVEAGVRGTPTFFINGTRIPGAIPEDVLEAIIENLLNA